MEEVKKELLELRLSILTHFTKKPHDLTLEKMQTLGLSRLLTAAHEDLDSWLIDFLYPGGKGVDNRLNPAKEHKQCQAEVFLDLSNERFIWGSPELEAVMGTVSKDLADNHIKAVDAFLECWYNLQSELELLKASTGGERKGFIRGEHSVFKVKESDAWVLSTSPAGVFEEGKLCGKLCRILEDAGVPLPKDAADMVDGMSDKLFGVVTEKVTLPLMNRVYMTSPTYKVGDLAFVQSKNAISPRRVSVLGLFIERSEYNAVRTPDSELDARYPIYLETLRNILSGDTSYLIEQPLTPEETLSGSIFVKSILRTNEIEKIVSKDGTKGVAVGILRDRRGGPETVTPANNIWYIREAVDKAKKRRSELLQAHFDPISLYMAEIHDLAPSNLASVVVGARKDLNSFKRNVEDLRTDGQDTVLELVQVARDALSVHVLDESRTELADSINKSLINIGLNKAFWCINKPVLKRLIPVLNSLMSSLCLMKETDRNFLNVDTDTLELLEEVKIRLNNFNITGE